MSEPYASVIVPTHDRSFTLDLTLRSLCAQSVHNIEIILALDGATDAVRDVAKKAASLDKRIRILDLPKAPGRGSANRSIAVKSARSDRIFYTDDDDLWLRDHVERLGALLEKADVAYSPVLSAALSGHFHFGFVDYTNSIFRKLLHAGKHKIIFDTHLAHRHSTYLRVGDPWATNTDAVVYNLLSALTLPGVSWLSYPKPTALSVHGAARTKLGGIERREELQNLSAEIERTDRQTLVQNARVEWYLQLCMFDVDFRKFRSIDKFLAAIGFHIKKTKFLPPLIGAWQRAATAPLGQEQPVELTASQREAAITTWEMHSGIARDATLAARILPHLIEPLLGGEPLIDLTASKLVNCFGYDRSIEIIEKAPDDNSISHVLLSQLRDRVEHHYR